MAENDNAKLFVETLVKSAYVRGVYDGLSTAQRAAVGAGIMLPKDMPVRDAMNTMASVIKKAAEEARKSAENFEEELRFLRCSDNETIQ